MLGTTYDVTLDDALPIAASILVSGLSDSAFQGIPLPAPLPSAPGCNLLASADTTNLVITSNAGSASFPVPIPNLPNLVGIEIYHQWVVLDPVNPLGIAVSDAGKATIGI